jgi:hypothetical protein
MMQRSVDGLQGRSGIFKEKKNLLLLSGIEPQFLCRPACSLVIIMNDQAGSFQNTLLDKKLDTLKRVRTTNYSYTADE